MSNPDAPYNLHPWQAEAIAFFGGQMNVTKITPEQYARGGTEHCEQVALMIWRNDMRLAGVFPDELGSLFAIANGGLRNKATAGRLKAEGVKEGVSDLFLPVVRFNTTVGTTQIYYHGLWVEMKKLRVKNPRKDDPEFGATDEQREWIALMRSRGYAATVCHGWIEASEVILSYLKLPA